MRFSLELAWLSDGGASRDRTDDPLLAKQVLSQLSYGPIKGRSRGNKAHEGPLPGTLKCRSLVRTPDRQLAVFSL